jgi:leucyl-tRNA synthetase
MSKSRFNVVNPDTVVEEYGADSLRLYEMFLGPLDRDKPWAEEGVQGVWRFLRRVWSLYIGEDGSLSPKIVDDGGEEVDLQKILHATIKAVTEDIENLQFNTAISRMMEFTNAATKAEKVDWGILETFALLLAPFAPHLAEEVWERLGHSGSLAYEAWPEWDESLLVEESVKIPVQVQGKLRDTIEVSKDADKETILAAAKASEKVQRHLDGKEIVKEIYVPGRMVNLVVK